MALNFNIEPFYDDYDETKKFYRILFRPGYAVQARELTQLQTILQEQIRRHGDHMFKNGAMIVPGQISYDANTAYVKLEENISGSTSVKTFSILSDITGKIYENSSGVQAIILTSTPKEVVGGVIEPDTIFVKYVRGTGTFSQGETLSPVDGTGLNIVVQAAVNNPLGQGVTATIQQGIYYIKNHFVFVEQQTKVVSKYNTIASAKIGLQVNESVVYPEDDESLLDNALGSPNYAAPGAARYYIDLVLTSKSYDATVDSEEFITLLTLKDGNVQYLVDKTQYAQIEKTLARRTFDESGDYTVRDFPIQIRDYRNNDRGAWSLSTDYLKGDIVTSNGKTYKCINDHLSSTTGSFATGIYWLEDNTPVYNYGLYQGPTFGNIETDLVPLKSKISLAVEPGKAYVRGYEIEKIATQYLTLDKARGASHISPKVSRTIDTSPGNYVILSSVNALPDINTDVVFYDRYGAAGTVPVSGVVVATANVKQIQMHTASPLTYKVFLFNMSVASGKVFSRDAKFAYSATGTAAETRFSGIIVPTRIQLPGTLSVSTNSITVSGVNTTFTADLKVGDYVSISGSEYRVATIASNNSITINTAVSITAGTLIYRVEATINQPNLIDAYYRIPQYATNSTEQFTYSFYKKTTTESNVITAIISETTYSLGSPVDEENFIVVDTATGNHLTQVADTATLTAGTYKITSATSDSIAFQFHSASTYDIVYCVEKNSGSSTPINKTLTNVVNEVVTLTNGVAVLTKADGYELQKVTSTVTVGQTTTVTDVTSKFSFDTGVRSSHYDLARISLLPGEVAPDGIIKVTYSYFAHTGAGDYYAVNSYTHNTSNIEYGDLSSEQINSVDFRPLRASDGTFSGCKIPKYKVTTTFAYDYYLGRIDKLSLSTSGDYIITKGIPDSIPSVPPSPKDSMDLYTFNIEPYTFKGSTASVVPYKIENKRYTMRDIGRLESRINNLEYYATLSLLEQNTLSSKSYDSYGLERPQNGFIVDDFTGQGIGLASSLDWQASVDIKAGELRPFFKTTNIALLEEVGTTLDRSSKNYEINGDLITLKIASKTPLVSQLRASHSESVNPFNIFVFNGSLEITPWNDTWYETQRRPDIIINDTSQYDAVVAKAEKDGVLGTVYKSWSTNWIGETVTGTQTHVGDRRWGDGGAWLDQEFGIGPEAPGWARREVTVETFARTGTKTYTGGVKTFIQSNVTDRVVEDKIVSTELIPYMRSRKILFRGDSLKPDTRMYAFFDGINVDTHITPAKKMQFSLYGTSTIPTFATNVNVGSNINNEARKTSEGEVSSAYTYGEVLRQYYITSSNTTPFDTGVTCVVVGQETYKGANYVYIDNIKGGTISNATEVINPGQPNSVTRTYYLQAEFDSSRKIQKFGNIETPTNLITTKTGQLFGTFTIPNGSSMSFRTGTKLLRFSDNAANIRANAATSAEAEYTAKGILEIKERTILSTKTASVVSERVPDRTESVTTTGSRVSGDTGWYDPLAQTFLVDIEGGAFITDVDLFFAQVDENLPIKIQIRNVVNGYPGPMIIPFSEVILQPSQVKVHNKGALATNFKFRSPIYLQNGVEYALVVLSDSAKYRVWISEAGQVDVDGSGLISQQPYAGVLFKSQNASTWTAEQNQDLKFRINRAVFDTSGTATVTLINQHVNADTFYDVANVSANKIVLPGTSLSATLNNVNGTANNNISIPLDQDIEFTQQQKLKDKTEENGAASFKTTIVMSSTKDNVSPVLDVSRCSATLVSNIIENGTSDEEQYPEIGSAKAKYITKQIKLNQPSTNLRILFDSNVPSNAAVKVYYKTGLQGTNFSDAEFIEVTSPTAFTKPIRKLENARQFTESEINLQLNPFDIVQVKLVMKSSNTAKVPRVKALRVIAYA